MVQDKNTIPVNKAEYYKRTTEKAMSKMILVTTTFNKKEDAINLAKHLLKKRLIACAQLSSPVESLYWWKGSIEQEMEYTLSVKSSESLWNILKDEIKSAHPYDVPEIIATPVVQASDEYKEWLLEELQI